MNAIYTKDPEQINRCLQTIAAIQLLVSMGYENLCITCCDQLSRKGRYREARTIRDNNVGELPRHAFVVSLRPLADDPAWMHDIDVTQITVIEALPMAA